MKTKFEKKNSWTRNPARKVMDPELWPNLKRDAIWTALLISVCDSESIPWPLAISLTASMIHHTKNSCNASPVCADLNTLRPTSTSTTAPIGQKFSLLINWHKNHGTKITLDQIFFKIFWICINCSWDAARKSDATLCNVTSKGWWRCVTSWRQKYNDGALTINCELNASKWFD